MKTRTVWKEKMLFSGEAGDNQTVMDAKSPIGTGKGLTPKELLALSISGCTGMDVAALLKKYRQPMDSLAVDADVTMTENVYPTVFSNVQLTFEVTGGVDKEKLIEAVRLSQTKYCGVTAMVSKAVPIHYRIVLNGEEIGTGKADFN